jgi:hypothetical protein
MNVVHSQTQMFGRIIQKKTIHASFRMANPSPQTIDAFLTMIHSVREFDWLNVEVKVADCKGYTEIRSKSLNLNTKEDVIDILNSYIHRKDNDNNLV